MLRAVGTSLLLRITVTVLATSACVGERSHGADTVAADTMPTIPSKSKPREAADAGVGLAKAPGSIPKSKEPPRPFYIDSTYDRFKNEQSVRLWSRTVRASRDIELRWNSGCEPNGYCGNLAIRLQYTTGPVQSAAERQLWSALDQDIVCIDLIFYTPPGEKRDEACFRRGASARDEQVAVVVLLDLTGRLTAAQFRASTRVEGRVSGEGTEFEISEAELRKLDTFWIEYDRRCTQSGESSHVNCFAPL
jgi:hypothetical protein